MMKCLDSQETVEAKREFVAKQTKEAKTTGRVTIRNCGSIPVWIAFRCLYCGEYYNQAMAEEHFGMTRNEFFEQASKINDTALKYIIKLRNEIKDLKAENKQLKQYREYVMDTISRGSMPMEFQEWNQTVDELARDLEEHLKGG